MQQYHSILQKGSEEMKPASTKTEFIRLRAEGKSYDAIAKELHISKATCKAWEKELADKISLLKAEQLKELYDTYQMSKEARIKKLGGTLKRIDDALAAVDLSEMPPEKLLDFKLKYEEALKDEYIPISDREPLKEDFREQDLLRELADLLNRVKSGATTREQAATELTVYQNMLRAYEDVELKKKIETLEALLGDR